MPDRYYSIQPLGGERVTLEGDEAHHLARVMRAQRGEEVVLFDGTGVEAHARVADISRRVVTLEVIARSQPRRELPGCLTVAVALPKGERQRFLVEKCVELGVHRLQPLHTARGVAEGTPSAVARWERYVIESSKQAGRTRLLEVLPPRTPGELFAAAPAAGEQRWIAEPRGTTRFAPGPTLAATIAIGPEGGWTATELAQAAAAGWQLGTLGPRVLRVETAAMLAAALVAAAWESQP